MNEQQVLAVVQQCINACAQRGYVAPYDITITDENGARLGVHIDENGARGLLGDIAASGEISGSTLVVSVIDAKLRYAEFTVQFDLELGGKPLRPIIKRPAEWDGN